MKRPGRADKTYLTTLDTTACPIPPLNTLQTGVNGRVSAAWSAAIRHVHDSVFRLHAVFMADAFYSAAVCSRDSASSAGIWAADCL
jgi:hypothetical protein